MPYSPSRMGGGRVRPITARPGPPPGRAGRGTSRARSVLTLVAGIANRGTAALPWIAAAFGLYLVAVVITVAVNVPLNDAIKAAGDPAHIDVAQVRARCNEARWAAWNLVRVATSVPAFGLLAWALVLCGRATA